MANHVNKVVINDVVKLDLTQDTVTADKLMSGYTAHSASGEAIIGTHECSSSVDDFIPFGDDGFYTVEGYALSVGG